VRDVASRRVRQAGLKKTCVFDLRRTFISDLLEAGKGGSWFSTTRRYDRRGEVASKKSGASAPCGGEEPLCWT